MKLTVLTGSPRKNGNTAALTEVFLEECARLGLETECIDLDGARIQPCKGCMVCQDVHDGLGCVQQDDLQQIFDRILLSDVLVFATPIYAWYCTAPMKAFMDRAIYAGNKNYGREKGPALLNGKLVATVVTCGYPVEKGADLWVDGLKRWCKHGKMRYLGEFCRRDMGRNAPFMDEEKELAVRDFAKAVVLSARMEEL